MQKYVSLEHIPEPKCLSKTPEILNFGTKWPQEDSFVAEI